MTCRILLVVVTLLLAAPGWAGDTRPFLKGSYDALVKEHAGRPLVVHFWSLTCAPCLVELPHWQEVRRRHPGLELVLVATDPLDDAPRLERTLKRAGLAGVESWAFADSFAERLRFEIDRGWRGELPMTRLIGRDGSVEAVTGSVSDATLTNWLGRGKP